MAAAPILQGLGCTDPTAFTPFPTVLAGCKLNADGQTALAAASAVANQRVGAVTLPALAAAATSTVTISNSLITAQSYVQLTVKRGTTTAGAGAVATVVLAGRIPTAGSLVVDVTNLGSAATLSTDYEAIYEITN